MQQIMDEELAIKLYEDECKALELRLAMENAIAHEQFGECGEEDDNVDEDYGDDQEQDGDEFDYMDEYAVRGDKSGQYISLGSASKGFNSLRETMRRQEKDDCRKAPLRQSTELSKFGGKDNAFDERTRMVLLKLMNQGKLDVVHGRINTGKEANTYRAVGSDEETSRELQYAVKIFKTARADYTKSNECDTSGRQYNAKFIKKTLRRQLKEWTEKEYKNLHRASSCGVQTPKPLLFKDHVLIMDFVGDDGVAAPKLKDAVLTNAQLNLAYVDVLRSVRALYQKAQLVHSRLSEANILYHNDKCWIVDFSEATTRTQPGHDELLEQDLVKIHAFFRSRGMRRVTKDALGMLSTATAKEFVVTEEPESVLKYYPLLQQALLSTT